ncbi:hypothetical protein AB6A40_008423 [Gnathostoma spinigerum]|uniref:Schwannomin interacting protein 1 C-terminal domain-containing protein n=1 Tax=Gnathostoma spinigerum TaxID=75299 RepID=A0ABD6EU54_9BILA
MWAMNSPAESTPTVDIRDKANNNTICAESLLSKLIEVPLSNSAQHSNTSSLESLESPPLDENRAISTSCSENSFEMSSTISRPNTNTNTSSDCCALSSDISPTTTVPQRVTSGLKPNGHGLQMHELQEVIDQMQSTSESTSVCDDQQQIEVSNDCSSKYDTTSYDEMFAPWQRMPSTSKSMGAFPTFDSRERVRQSIESELDKLDTCLPNLDFDKLEQQLKCAEQERQTTERKLLGEQVRRRLALQVDQLTAGPSPRVYTRPSRSNLGYRLQTAMNLQVCYMNDLDDDDDDDDEDDLFDSSEDDFYVPKSKSAPNLHGHVADGSSMKATELRQRAAPSDYCKIYL